MSKLVPLALALALVSPALLARGAGSPQAEHARALEPAGDSAPLGDGIGAQERADPPSRALLLELTQSARLAGTSGGEWGAQIVARWMRQAGLEVELDRREVLLSLPRELELALYEDGFATRPFHERLDVFDPDANPPGDVPPYSAWSPSGEVRGRVVDAGYGLADDFARLERAGVKLAGTVALVRYGRAYRGAKVEFAARHGCVAVLLFSDPADDGAGRGAVWPEGPWKPDWAVQRGSISPMGRAPGDPSTPGWASPAPGERARRLSGEALRPALPPIPCLPIPAREAALLQAKLRTAKLGDEDARPLGPGPVEARLRLAQEPSLRPIVNVIARLPGRESTLVVAGSHRDAWVRGAQDSGGGVVALARAAQQLAARRASGWQPRSTLVFAFWDAEEQGLIGSTEWAEAHEELLARELVGYVNADASVSGTRLRGIAGTPGLLGLCERALSRVEAAPGAPEGVRTLWDELVDSADEHAPALSLPGSGSDFAVFLHHLGLPVVELGLGGNGGGQYHTRFDDFAVVDRFLDPGFVGHEKVAALLAALVEELSEAGREALDPAELGRALAATARAAGAQTEPEAWLGAERGERLARAFERLAGAADAPRDVYRRLRRPQGLEGRAWFTGPLWSADPRNGYGTETFPTLRAAARAGEAELERELARLIVEIDRVAGTREPAAASQAGAPESPEQSDAGRGAAGAAGGAATGGG